MIPTLESPRIELVRDPSRPGRWSAVGGRFVVVRHRGRGDEPVSYDITDTTRADWVGRAGQGATVRVYEFADVRPVIARALRDTPRRGRSTS